MVLHVETLNYVNPKILLFCILLWIKYDKKPKNKKTSVDLLLFSRKTNKQECRIKSQDFSLTQLISKLFIFLSNHSLHSGHHQVNLGKINCVESVEDKETSNYKCGLTLIIWRCEQ